MYPWAGLWLSFYSNFDTVQVWFVWSYNIQNQNRHNIGGRVVQRLIQCHIIWVSWAATIISFLLWNSSLIKDCMFEVIDEHIRETERSIMARLCLDDFFEIQIQCQINIPLIICFFFTWSKFLAVTGLSFWQFTGRQNDKIKKITVTGFLQVTCLGSDSWNLFPVSMTHIFTHLAVMVAHGQQSNGAVGVTAVADGGYVPVPHDGHGGQRLARGVRVRDGVALPAWRGQLWAEREVLLNLLVLGLVEVELGALQVALYLWQQREAPV